jgi:hypothetical protein
MTCHSIVTPGIITRQNRAGDGDNGCMLKSDVYRSLSRKITHKNMFTVAVSSLDIGRQGAVHRLTSIQRTSAASALITVMHAAFIVCCTTDIDPAPGHRLFYATLNYFFSMLEN